MFELRDESDIKDLIDQHQELVLKLSRSISNGGSRLEPNLDQDGEEEKKEETVFNRAFYFDDKVKDIVQEIIDKAISIMKKDWQSNYVIYPIMSMESFSKISARQTFITYEIEAPMMDRFNRFCAKYQGEKDITLEEFVKIDDEFKFGTDYLSTLNEETGGKVSKKFTNDKCWEDLIGKITKYDFSRYNIIRPDWDTYFMKLAYVAATRSNCMKRAVGAIVVNPDKQIVATGYNGTTFGYDNCFEGGCKR